MKKSIFILSAFFLFTSGLIRGDFCVAADQPNQVVIRWDKVVGISNTASTLQVVVNPPLRRDSPIHDAAFAAVQNLGCDLVRYVPWLPYPKLAVAELEPPKDGKTFWDFSLIDPMLEDFMRATEGHSVMLNFSTIPAWLFQTPRPVTYPADPNQVTWDYTQGAELRDATLKELADYYSRVVGWYTQGGFEDEFHQWHASGHYYKFDYWEVFNEPDLEHKPSPQQYTERYDAVVQALRLVAPDLKFAGLALAYPSGEPEYFDYFLDHAHHKPGVPLDMITYHFYAAPSADQTPEIQQYTFFDQADRFIATVRYIEAIRKRLSPETQTDANELGSIAASDNQPGPTSIPKSYWNLSGALYAYVYAELAKLGIDYAGESQLVGYPTQFPSVSMIDWDSGKPNARYWVLKLLHENFRPGDKILESDAHSPDVYALGMTTREGKRRVLLINKRDRVATLTLPGARGGEMSVVDQSTAFDPPSQSRLSSEAVNLSGLAVAVVTLGK